MKQRQSGFTLVEIAIVVVVIAMLAAMLIWSFGTVQKRSRDDSRDTAAKTLMAALKSYYNENGEFPDVCPGGLNIPCSATQYLGPVLTPSYLQTIPEQPNTVPFSYQRGTALNSYGIKLDYETSHNIYGTVVPCKTGEEVSTSWWTSAQDCSF